VTGIWLNWAKSLPAGVWLPPGLRRRFAGGPAHPV